MVLSLCQDDWLATLANGCDDIFANLGVPVTVRDQCLNKGVELPTRVRGVEIRLPESSGAYQDAVCKRTFGCLMLCIYAVAHRAALHEDNGMVAIFSDNGC